MTLADFLLARIAEDEAPVAGDWFNGGGDPDFQWGPNRIKVECEAKRQIVALHSEDEPGGGLHVCHDLLADETECGELRALASVYADHPDYREEWAL